MLNPHQSNPCGKSNDSLAGPNQPLYPTGFAARRHAGAWRQGLLMASHQAVMAVCQAVIDRLQSAVRPGDFSTALQFQVYLAKDFQKPMDAGVSLFLYRVYPNPVQRTPPGRLGVDGRRQRSQLPLDLHFLLTAWAQDATLQHAITGWMMRALEDLPSLPSGLLNTKFGSVFRSDEQVEITLAELPTEEMFRIWEVIAHHAYQLSVPYFARNVRIESQRDDGAGPPIQERDLRFGPPTEG
jgi:hypothetical protein